MGPIHKVIETTDEPEVVSEKRSTLLRNDLMSENTCITADKQSSAEAVCCLADSLDDGIWLLLVTVLDAFLDPSRVVVTANNAISWYTYCLPSC